MRDEKPGGSQIGGEGELGEPGHLALSEVRPPGRRRLRAPRVTAELKDAGIDVNHKRVERVMRRIGIEGVHLRKKVRTTRPRALRDAGARPAATGLHRE